MITDLANLRVNATETSRVCRGLNARRFVPGDIQDDEKCPRRRFLRAEDPGTSDLVEIFTRLC